MSTLYIIGNGFDLWHGLPTGFAQFYEFAKETLEELEQYLNLDSVDQNLWNDFERNIGKYDWKSFYDTHNIEQVYGIDKAGRGSSAAVSAGGLVSGSGLYG
ncbi:hypothetical protein D5085_05505 [Ectothiorhodospiraceae bacterium BW-2]|nr:hypothetical protein D5085_05505 [Ectothiorhodospiraceae bacterium BW-2]